MSSVPQNGSFRDGPIGPGPEPMDTVTSALPQSGVHGFRAPGYAGPGMTKIPCTMLPDFDPGQLVLVVKEMAQLRARDGGETAGGLMIGLALELDRADETAAGAGAEPALDESQEPLRITHDIREQPVDRSDPARVKREGALEPVLDPG